MGSKHKYQGDSVNVASIQTLNNREFPEADDVIIDEAHHCVLESNSYESEDSEAKKPSIFKAFFDHYNGKASITGLSATPRRLDGKPLGNVFKQILLPVVEDEPVDVLWLQEQGYLVPAVYWGAPIVPDLEKVGKVQGDFDTKELFNRLDKKVLYQGVVDNYKKHCAGKKAICFCLNIEHSKNTAAEFTAAGFRTGHLDGKMNTTDRDNILRLFADGYYQVLCNVGILTEGYDLPNIEVIIGFRPTDSESLWLQMLGRALRPVWPAGFDEYNSTQQERLSAIASSKKPYAIVLDQGLNCQRLGFAETRREYSLEKPRSRERGVSPIRECKEVDGGCGRLVPNDVSTCPDCGRDLTPEIVRTGPVRKDGELVELTPVNAPLPLHLRKLVSQMNILELEEFRSIKKHALGWVVKQLIIRAELAAKREDLPAEKCVEKALKEYGALVTATKKAYKPSWAAQQLDKYVVEAYYND
jgi:DNA repair protein RadD